MRAGLLVAVCLAAVLLFGCGEGGGSETTESRAAVPPPKERPGAPSKQRSDDAPKEKRQLVLTLAGWRGPESAGVVMADERGYFADVGLDVSVLSPASPARPVQYVANRTDDLGVAQQPQVLMAKENGVPIVAFGSLVSEPTAAMIWLRDSKIRGIEDLRGKTIAIQGLPFQRGFLESILARGGLTLDDVTVKSVEYKLVPSLVSGRADAIFGGSRNVEGLELESRGLDPVIAPVESLGVPPYEEGVWITRSDFAAKNPKVLRDFISAVRRGTAAAIEDPKKAAMTVVESFEVNPELGPKEMEAGVEAMLPLLSETGRMSLGKASDLEAWMRDQGLLGE
jgi:putative hydroxymethylpyrimidine transport system substrate-binding protein